VTRRCPALSGNAFVRGNCNIIAKLTRHPRDCWSGLHETADLVWAGTVSGIHVKRRSGVLEFGWGTMPGLLLERRGGRACEHVRPRLSHLSAHPACTHDRRRGCDRMQKTWNLRRNENETSQRFYLKYLCLLNMPIKTKTHNKSWVI